MFNSLVLIFLAALNSTIGNLLLKLSRENNSTETSLISSYLSLSFLGAIFLWIKSNNFCEGSGSDTVKYCLSYSSFIGLYYACHYFGVFFQRNNKFLSINWIASSPFWNFSYGKQLMHHND